MVYYITCYCMRTTEDWIIAVLALNNHDLSRSKECDMLLAGRENYPWLISAHGLQGLVVLIVGTRMVNRCLTCCHESPKHQSQLATQTCSYHQSPEHSMSNTRTNSLQPRRRLRAPNGHVAARPGRRLGSRPDANPLYLLYYDIHNAILQ